MFVPEKSLPATGCGAILDGAKLAEVETVEVAMDDGPRGRDVTVGRTALFIKVYELAEVVLYLAKNYVNYL
jgi:hypothetical protein